MWRMGSNDWIKYGWGDELKTEWFPDDILIMDYTSFDISNLPNNAIAAAIETVEEIVKTYPAPYTLMCSGGIDSQAMIWAWHKANVPFEIVSVRYISNGIFFNEHDLEQLIEFCNKYNFNIIYKDFDLINFLEVNLPEIANKYDCHSPQFCTHIKMSEVIEHGTILYGGNFITPGISYVFYSALGLHRYDTISKTKTRRVIPFFFLHNPKLAHAFLDIILDSETPINKYNTRYEIYQAAGFPVISQKEKFNGFEKIKEYYDKYFNRVKPIDKLRFASKPSKRTFDLLFRYPFEGSGKCKASRHTGQIHNFKRGSHE
jgi:hypothetical protein